LFYVLYLMQRRRTWNLMIDVIVQSGHYPPNAGTLAGFMVEGKKRYWLHVAIDGLTAEIRRSATGSRFTSKSLRLLSVTCY